MLVAKKQKMSPFQLTAVFVCLFFTEIRKLFKGNFHKGKNENQTFLVGTKQCPSQSVLLTQPQQVEVPQPDCLCCFMQE